MNNEITINVIYALTQRAKKRRLLRGQAFNNQESLIIKTNNRSWVKYCVVSQNKVLVLDLISFFRKNCPYYSNRHGPTINEIKNEAQLNKQVTRCIMLNKYIGYKYNVKNFFRRNPKVFFLITVPIVIYLCYKFYLYKDPKAIFLINKIKAFIK